MSYTLVSAAGSIIDLGADIADRLNALVAEPDLLDALAEALGQEQPELPPRLEKLLADQAFRTLRTFLRRAAGTLSPDEHLRLLAGPVAEVPSDGIPWSWKSTRKRKLPPVGALTLSLKGDAKASVRVLPGPRYEFKGALGAAGDLRAPFSFGRVSFSRRRSRKHSLIVKCVHADDTRVLEALRRDLPLIANLSNPESLLDAASFASARLTAAGSVRLGAAVRAGRSLTHALDAGGAAVSVRSKASVGYKLKWTRTGKFTLTVTRRRGGKLRVKLSESRKQGRERSLTLASEFRVSGLGNAMVPIMKDIGALPDDLERIVATWSNPSALLRARLRERLRGSDASVRALADVVAGGGEAAADRFCDTVIDSIVESADARVNDWTNVLDGRIEDLVADALSRLPLHPELRDKLTRIVNEKTGEALARLNDELEQDLRNALTESTDSVRHALGRFADDNLAAFESLDEAAEHCMVPLKQLLSTCRTIEGQVASAVEKAEKQRLSIRYAKTVSASDTSSTLLTFQLDPRDEHARALYRQMFGGDFTAAIDAGMNSDNAAITLEGGVFKRVLEREERSGLTFNLFGLGIESRRALSAELRVEQGPGGQVNILTAEGAVSESRTGFGEGQSIEISNLVDLVTSADSPDAFTAKLSYTDKKLKPKELRQYLGSLEEAGLLATGATGRSVKLEAAVGALRGPERAVRIETTLALTRAELVEATRADEDAIVRTAIEEQLKAYRRVGWAGAALRRLEALTGNAAIDVLVKWRDSSGRDVRRALRLGRHASKTDKDIVSLVPAITIRARMLASFVSRWRELESFAATASNGVNGLDETALREIQDLHVAATANLKVWADASNLLIRLSRADVSPVAAAFLASLRRLCSKSDEHLVPMITWTEDGEERQIAVV